MNDEEKNKLYQLALAKGWEQSQRGKEEDDIEEIIRVYYGGIPKIDIQNINKKPIDYEYTGIAKDTYYPIKTFFADEYDSYKSFEIRDEEYGQAINTNKDSVIWEDSPELVNIQEEFDKEIEEFNYANDNEFEDEEIPDTIYEQQSGEFRIVEQEEIINASINESFLVNAGPGTGKTYTLIHKINHIINELIKSDTSITKN